eukprot:TRINITY_DN25618_c0_g1_i1.p1 TRINITY_DN25618_c0_g1~~TRINITY_DN25618_c0_g1_i1.p1  ORF type:complete len:1156 (-),score=164.76 TRINITY_DN25618_c0_g1_i1:94-3138(-)
MAARVLLPAFSLDGMKEYYDIIRECTEMLASKVGTICESGAALELHPMLSNYTFEVIGRVGFGQKFNAITNPDGCTFLRNFEASSQAQARVKSSPFRIGQIARGLFTGDLIKMRNLQKENLKQIDAILNTKRELLAQCPVSGASDGACPVKDMAERMLTLPDPESNELLPQELVTANTLTFLVAGHDSTSTAITMLLYQVAMHPEVEQKIFEEVARVVGDKPLTWDLFGKLTYCTQVVKESLRLFPPAPQFVKNSPIDRDTTLGKYRIPAGSSFICSVFALHFNPSVYPDPHAFQPERWEGEEAAKRSPYAWLPFSYGKRACIGMQLSLIEQRVALVELVRKYHIRVDPSTKLTITQPLFMNPQGIYLRFFLRSASAMSIPPPSATCLNLKSVVGVTSLSQVEKLAGKRLLVLFASNMGTCEGFASRIVRQGADLGLECSKAPLDALALDNPPKVPSRGQGFVLIVTSTYNGQPPENAKAFASWLDSERAALLGDVCFSVFGCGNRQWAATYQFFGRQIHEKLVTIGAECIAPMGEGDMDSGGIEMEFTRWSLACTVGIFRSEGIAVPPALNEQLYPEITPFEVWVWDSRRICDLSLAHRASVLKSVTERLPLFKSGMGWTASVGTNRELLTAKGRSTKHIELPLPPGMTYSAGDHIGVIGASPAEVVLAYMKRVQMAPHAVVKCEPGIGETAIEFLPSTTPVAAYSVLAFCVELQQPATRVQMHWLSKRASGSTKERLEALADFEGTAYTQHILASRRTLLEVLQEFPEVTVSFGDLLALLPANKPRFYSISSSPKALPNAVSITVSVVQGASPTGRKHIGMCSNYLGSQPFCLPEVVEAPGGEKPNMPLLAVIKDTGSSFRLPKTNVPIVMVGPGTGLAPMRGFLQDRVFDGLKDNLLFFGCRGDDDFLYREELEAWVAGGFLELHVAFSRKSNVAKTYVQQLIERESTRVIELLKEGAHVYVCGDATQMAPCVRAAFGRICESAGLGGLRFVDELVECGRYCQDVWAAQSH